MANVEAVTPTGPDTTHREPNSTVGWITNSGADVDSAGVVRFRETAPGITLVEVVLDYADPPGGRLGDKTSGT
jgi:uncharacterized membrane protein